MIEQYFETFEDILFKYTDKIDFDIDIPTLDFLSKIGLPLLDIEIFFEGSFYPKKMKRVFYDSFPKTEFYSIGLMSLELPEFRFLLKEKERGIYFFTSEDGVISDSYLVNSDVEAFAYYLYRFHVFFVKLDLVNDYLDSGFTNSKIKDFLLEEFDSLIDDLIFVDKVALIDSNFWYIYRVSNFYNGFIEFLSRENLTKIVADKLEKRSHQ